MELAPSVSIARHQAWFSLGAPLVSILSLVLGIIVGADRHRARRLLRVVAWSGAAYGTLGIAAFLIDPTKLLWRDKLAHLSSLTTPFPNRNTAAVYFGSCAIVCLLLLAEHMRHTTQRGIDWHKIAVHSPERPDRGLLTMSGMLLLCMTAMFLTGSRAGIFLSLIALVLAFITYSYHSSRRRMLGPDRARRRDGAGVYAYSPAG